jgi:hypothetical protein
VVRVLTIGVALLCLLAAWIEARRSSRTVVAVLLATIAMLLLPAAIWYHYLAVLLPLATVAWCRADARARAALFTGGALISVALAFLGVALVGAALLVVGALRGLRDEAAGTPGATEAAVPRLP